VFAVVVVVAPALEAFAVPEPVVAEALPELAQVKVAGQVVEVSGEVALAFLVVVVEVASVSVAFVVLEPVVVVALLELAYAVGVDPAVVVQPWVA
jgi:hypothetical protein